MRQDLAININIGDTLYNCFMEPLTVINKKVWFSNPDHYSSIGWIKFIVRDSHNNTHEYSSNDLYLKNLDDESDEEKSWINWAKDNKEFFESFDHIETMKEIYKIGFSQGFEYKKILSHQEILQK